MKSALSVIDLPPNNELNIAKKTIIGSKQEGPFVHNNYYYYYMGGHKTNLQQHPLRQWMSERFWITTGRPLLPGSWMTADGIRYDNGVFSLVQFIKGCTYVEAFMYVADSLGTKFSAVNVPQHETNDRYVFIRDSHTYPENIANPLLNGGYSPIDSALECLPKKYFFYNTHGYPSFFLYEWDISGNGPVRLFQTLQFEKATGNREWKFFSPPTKYLIYNRHLIDRDKNKEVLIYDQIDTAASFDTNNDLATATWSGDLSIYRQLDWSFLKDRCVTYIFIKNDHDSIKIGLKLIEEFEKMRTRLQLRYISHHKLK